MKIRGIAIAQRQTYACSFACLVPCPEVQGGRCNLRRYQVVPPEQAEAIRAAAAALVGREEAACR